MKTCRISASDLDQMVWYYRMLNMSTDDLCQRLLHKAEPNEKMRVGTLWHEVLENSTGDIDEIDHGGYHFKVLADAHITLPKLKEDKSTIDYQIGDVLVTLVGKVDAIDCFKIIDHKATFKAPNLDTYMESYQWKAYLEIFKHNVFEYIAYQCKIKGKTVSIVNVDKLKMYRYPGMKMDLFCGIIDLLDFFKAYLPEKIEEK